MSDAIEHLPPLADIELKQVDGDPTIGLIEGYASYFGERDGGNDIVVRGAFAKSLKTRRKENGAWKIPMLFGHVYNGVPVGVWTEIGEDTKGLRVKGRIILASDQARQVYEVMKAGGEMGISIGYRTIKRELETVKDAGDMPGEITIRKLLEVDLREISLVPLPMLDSARVLKVKGEGPDDATPAHAAEVIRALDGVTQSLGVKAAFDRVLHTLKP
jgi:HK97 family phage prohead protease